MESLEMSSMFSRIDKEGISRKEEYKGKSSSVTNTIGSFGDIEEVLENVMTQGDYSVIPLVLSFMKDLTPFDLFTFFDSFSSIEANLFAKRDIDYSIIQDSYRKNRKLITDKYVDFCIEYYKNSNIGMRQIVEEMEEEKSSFVRTRFATIQVLLIEIGKRLSHEYYTETITNPSSRS